MKSKIKWIIIGIVILVAIVALVVFIVNRMSYSYTVEEVKEFNYNILTKNERYGVINKNGEVVVEPIYDTVQIPNPSKPVFICMSDYNTETKEYKTTVLNDQKEILFSEYESVQAIPAEATLDGVPYEKSVLQYKQDGKYGLINLEGKVITKPIYEQISSINYKEGTLLVKQDGKFGAINMKGKVVIKPEYDSITSDNYFNTETKNEYTGFIVSKVTDEGYRYGYINYNGKVILNTEYNEIDRIIEMEDGKDAYLVAYKNGQAGLLKNNKNIINHEYESIKYNSLNDLFIVQRNSKQGVIDKEGKNILNIEYDNILFGGMYIDAQKDGIINVFDLQGNKIENTDIISKMKTDNENYFITVDRNDTYRIVDKDENVIIDNNYSYIEHISGEYFIVAKDGKNGIIDLTGKSLVDLKYSSIYEIQGTNLLQAEINNNKTVSLINSDMEIIKTMDNAIVEKKDNYIIMYSEDEFTYYDFNGNEKSAKDLFPNNKLFAKRINDKWGFVDVEGNLKVQNEYEMVTDFNEYGYAGIKQDGKWGVINQEGEIITKPIYELDWYYPTFIGKYYRLNIWTSESQYSDEIE